MNKVKFLTVIPLILGLSSCASFWRGQSTNDPALGALYLSAAIIQVQLQDDSDKSSNNNESYHSCQALSEKKKQECISNVDNLAKAMSRTNQNQEKVKELEAPNNH